MLFRPGKFTAVSMFRFLMLLIVPSSIAAAQQATPPFDWEHSFASPGTSLSIELLETMSGPPNGTVAIAIKAAGFSASPNQVVLWQKMGGAYLRHRPEVLADGTVLVVPGTDANMLGQYVRGQAFDIALHDGATGNRAQASIAPFPVAAQGNGDCNGSAEIQVSSGLLWVINLSGFDPGESVSISSALKKEILSESVVASESGRAAFPILYPPRAKGDASVQVTGEHGCEVNLKFAVGASALKAK